MRYRSSILLALCVACLARQAPAQMDFIGPRLGGRVFTPQLDIQERRAREADGTHEAETRFLPSVERRRAAYARFVERTRQVDPQGAAGLQETFKSDPVAAMAPELAKVGLRTDDVADAYAVYWVEAWQAAHGESGQSARETAQAVRRQVAGAMGPALAAATDAQKQEYAEALLVQALLIAAAREQAAGDANKLRGIAAAVRQGARASGLDLDAMTLTATRFVPAGRTVAGERPPADSAAQTAPGGDADLRAALAAVPADARAVQVVSHGTGSYVGWPASYVYKVTTYLLFNNGWMTLCADWDPGQLRPTPESLGRAYPDCGLRRWRRSTAGLQMQAEDGSWTGLTDAAEGLRSFRPGETLDLAFGNVGGIGFAGPVSVNALSGGELRMTPAGDIAVGSWSSVVISGNGVGGGSNGRSRPVVGKYRLDGNVIAVRDASGTISRGFVAGVPAAGPLEHIYLNGRQFWKGDD